MTDTDLISTLKNRHRLYCATLVATPLLILVLFSYTHSIWAALSSVIGLVIIYTLYINKNPHVAPYLGLPMLAMTGLGLFLPLPEGLVFSVGIVLALAMSFVMDVSSFSPPSPFRVTLSRTQFLELAHSLRRQCLARDPALTSAFLLDYSPNNKTFILRLHDPFESVMHLDWFESRERALSRHTHLLAFSFPVNEISLPIATSAHERLEAHLSHKKATLLGEGSGLPNPGIS